MSRTDRYPVPAEEFRCEHEVERSRFITTVTPVESEEDARAFVARLKDEFPDANHNCWAYLIGPPGSSDRTGMSDDGEPHGCAGKPMLTALMHADVGDIAVVVTRYFGGIKLGKGGMVKAYTSSVLLGLKEMPQAEKIPWVYRTITIDYTVLASVERILADYEVEVLEKGYADRVSLQIRLPQEQLDLFCQQIIDMTSGAVTIETTD